MSDEREESTPKRTTSAGMFHGIQLCIVQCSVCLLAVLLSLCLKYTGGSVYQNCVEMFRVFMTEQHTLLSAMPQTVRSSAQPAVTTDITQPISLSVPAVSSKVIDSPKTSPPLNEGVLTSPYGYRTDPFDERSEVFHDGVDIAAPEGTPLLALQDGVVREVGESAGYGKYVLVQCDERNAFLYAHCSEVPVESEDTVKAGDCIALVGNTGRSTGSHVHIEWRENGEAVDPSDMVPLERYD